MPIKTTSTPQNLQILHEDNHLIVVNKRPGDIVQGDITGDRPLSEVVKMYIKNKYEKPGAVYLGVVHRLDRPTSGVVVFARTSKALARVNKALATRQTHKVYWAVVRNRPPEEQAILVHWLRKNPKQNKSYVVQQEAKAAKKAELEYRLVKKLDHYFLLEIELKTGRHHQIRAQLAEIGCPIKGDLKYGAERSNKDGSIHLHARSLTFEHPVRKTPLEIVAPPPSDPVWNDCE